MRRRLSFLILLACLGCQTVWHPAAPPHPINVPPAAITPASRAVEVGGERIPSASPSLPAAAAAPPAVPEKSDLRLAAACLEQGDEARACEHLARFLSRQPQHRNARFYYAELLLRQGRLGEARLQFEHVAADLQEEHVLDLKHLTHCHTRLAEVGEREEDEFERQLHRGIALYWLAQAPAASQEEDDLLPAEGLLCKAALSLQRAHRIAPDEARPCWYLHNVWRRLGQTHPANRFLHLAEANAHFSTLTAAEQRGLLLAR